MTRYPYFATYRTTGGLVRTMSSLLEHLHTNPASGFLDSAPSRHYLYQPQDGDNGANALRAFALATACACAATYARRCSR